MEIIPTHIRKRMEDEAADAAALSTQALSIERREATELLDHYEIGSNAYHYAAIRVEAIDAEIERRTNGEIA